jgi:hypothetical protein
MNDRSVTINLSRSIIFQGLGRGKWEEDHPNVGKSQGGNMLKRVLKFHKRDSQPYAQSGPQPELLAVLMLRPKHNFTDLIKVITRRESKIGSIKIVDPLEEKTEEVV